jgi:RHS repeat-associated protein
LKYGSVDNIRQKFTGYERDNETDLDFAQARYHNFNLGRFNSPDPARMLKARMADPQHWNLYVYARNNPIGLVDIIGEFPWTFHIRSFIQTSSVGGGLYRGDGRGPSLETDPNKASSRIRLNFTFDYDRGRITNRQIKSDPTVFYGFPGIPGFPGTRVGPIAKEGSPQVEFSAVLGLGSSKGVSLHYWGNDPIPGYVTPEVDVYANISISESITKFGNGTLSIAGTFSGDQYPSTEAFVVDQSGKTKVFLGAKFEDGGLKDTYGDNRTPLFKVDFRIKFDRKGNFIAVIQDGRTFTIEEWNKRVRAQF